MGKNESNVKKGFGLGCGVAIGLLVGIAICVIMVPILGISMCGFATKSMRDFAAKSDAYDQVEETTEAELAEQQAEKKDYISKLNLQDVKVSETILGGMGVFGEVKNTGDRSLKKVEITVYCLDKSGSPVFEETFHPVLVSKWSSGKSEVLKPNYTEKFGYKLDDAPSDWAGKVDVKITDIEFYIAPNTSSQEDAKPKTPKKEDKSQQEIQKLSAQTDKFGSTTKKAPLPEMTTRKGDYSERDAYNFVIAYGQKGWTIGNQIDGMVGVMRAQGDQCEVVDGQASRLRGDIFLVRCVVLVNKKEKHHYSWEANLKEQSVKPLSEYARKLHYSQ